MTVRILLVEDSDTQRGEYVNLLREAGINNITTANNGTEGLKAISTKLGTPEEIQIILTDYEMPQMTGLEMLKLLRENKATMNMPIVYMSSKGDFTVVTEFIKAKVSQMLVKPFKKEEMVDRLKEAWAKHHGA